MVPFNIYSDHGETLIRVNIYSDHGETLLRVEIGPQLGSPGI